jgi:hypothetical protein
MGTRGRLFAANRALGLVSNDVPLVVRYVERRKESVIVTCVGRHFHTYAAGHFTLLNVSGGHERDITALAADKYLVYTAAGEQVRTVPMQFHSLFYIIFTFLQKIFLIKFFSSGNGVENGNASEARLQRSHGFCSSVDAIWSSPHFSGRG